MLKLGNRVRCYESDRRFLLRASRLSSLLWSRPMRWLAIVRRRSCAFAFAGVGCGGGDDEAERRRRASRSRPTRRRRNRRDDRPTERRPDDRPTDRDDHRRDTDFNLRSRGLPEPRRGLRCDRAAFSAAERRSERRLRRGREVRRVRGASVRKRSGPMSRRSPAAGIAQYIDELQAIGLTAPARSPTAAQLAQLQAADGEALGSSEVQARVANEMSAWTSRGLHRG